MTNAEPKPKPRRRFQFSLKRLFVVVFVAAVVCSVLRAVPWTTPVDGIMAMIFGHQTIYSPKYTELGWLRVRPGMSKAAVVQLLGEPLNTGKAAAGVEVWEYTNYGPSESYHVRQVHFNKGLVQEKLAMFYVD